MYVREVLPNGVRLLSVPSRETRALTLLVLVGVGSRHETWRLAGVAHYIEHMLFKGTERWKTPSRLARELDAVGADYNAFTSKEYTGYYIRVLADKAPLALAILHEMLARPLFRSEEIERERGVILEEIAMYEDIPSAYVAEMLDGLLYSCPIGRNIAGTRESIRKLSRKDLVEFWKRHYRPPKLVVSVAGNVSEGFLLRVRDLFGSIPKGRSEGRRIPCASMPIGKPRVKMKSRESEQVQFALGVPALPYGHSHHHALSVMTTILGGGMSSRLFSEVRERRGLAYSIYATTSSYRDAGDLSVHAGLTKGKVALGVSTIMKELSKMARSYVRPSELKRAKTYLEGKMVIGLESSHDLAEFYAKQELLRGEIRTIKDRIAMVKSVTVEDVRKIARRILHTNRISATIVGHFEDEVDLKKLLKISL